MRPHNTIPISNQTKLPQKYTQLSILISHNNIQPPKPLNQTWLLIIFHRDFKVVFCHCILEALYQWTTKQYTCQPQIFHKLYTLFTPHSPITNLQWHRAHSLTVSYCLTQFFRLTLINLPPHIPTKLTQPSHLALLATETLLPLSYPSQHSNLRECLI